jgi:Na+-translocating ferredoxin:NAD+ oxidoreductase RnfC subunit
MKEFAIKVRRAGIVGMGGGGFPAYMKLLSSADTVIANGVECEPLLESDYYLLMNYTREFVEGLRVLAAEVGAGRVIIAVKRKRKGLIEHISGFLKNGMEITPIDDYYPAGDEFMLVRDTLGKIVPEGGIPLDIGVVVNNVATIVGYYFASKGKPSLSRFITVTGCVREPFTAEVPIGTRFETLIKAAGGTETEDYIILSGGVMMGETATLDDALSKRTSGIIVLPSDHPAAREQSLTLERINKIARSVCDQCWACSDFCSRLHLGHHIEPHKIMRMISFQLDQSAHATSIAHYCSKCGLCSLYACPLGISPRRVIEHLQQKEKKPEQPPLKRQPDPMVEFRRTPVSRLMARLRLEQYAQKETRFLEDIPAIEEVRIALCQGIGDVPVPVVTAGKRVTAGDVIAEPAEEVLGVALHASISGTVVDVTGDYITIKA